MKTILITGAGGFIGRVLVSFFHDEGFYIKATSRRGRLDRAGQANIEVLSLALDSNQNDYRSLLDGVDVVIHSAAHVHVQGKADNSWDTFHRLNVRATADLLDKAIKYNVKRFIFISSIEVNGRNSHTASDGMFSEADPPRPENFYARSKLEAECEIQKIAAQGQIEYVLLRPSLVYGPWVKANFLRLMQAIARGYPLPLGRFNPLRSILFVDNLCSAIRACMQSDRAANQLYLLCDDNVPLQDLIRMLGQALAKEPRLFPFPQTLFSMLAKLSGRRGMAESLALPRVMDTAKITRELAWSPPYSTQQGIDITAQWFLKEAMSGAR